MDQLRRLWESLTLQQKISIGVAALAVMGGLTMFLRYQDQRDFSILFSGLAVFFNIIARLFCCFNKNILLV